jgi:hypothetical protein
MMSPFVEGFPKRNFLEVNRGGMKQFWGKNKHFSLRNVLIVVLRGWER